MNELSPIVSEFDSEEAAEAYDAWFRAKVAASLADDQPVIAHDDAMAQVRAIIDRHDRGAQGA
ncbi:stability determinant [Sphingomonas sp.]|uniref:type II toxin-antitoxin system RelB family antitoxin n=1 Tax=Sphingomonas sp. TaxID=28214 RepID=UPI00262C07C9|nr:stability determinant [Sphingomonas sp.]